MSLFKIRLQTKAGNDVKNKQSFNIVFATSFKINAITGKKTGLYTYKIIYSKSYEDKSKVFEIKDSDNLINHEDLILKVIVNLMTVVQGICKEKNISPDLIMLNSVDFSTYKYVLNQLVNCFRDIDIANKTKTKLNFPKDYIIFNLITKFCASQQNTRFMCIDPTSSPTYVKSFEICKTLIKRISFAQI